MSYSDYQRSQDEAMNMEGFVEPRLAQSWVFISWEKHRRTRELCKDLGIKLLENDIRLPRYIRHPYLCLWTLYVIFRFRAKRLFVQNPSILLALLVVGLKRPFGWKVVVDSHNAGLRPDRAVFVWLEFLYRFVQKEADLTIVSNERLAQQVKQNGGKPFVLEDKLPSICNRAEPRPGDGTLVVAIATFSRDEPIKELLEAVQLLDDGLRVYITGDKTKLRNYRISRLPPQAVLTGYLPDTHYVELLGRANTIIDLTLREDCLVCGAYEGVALAKPLILSDTMTLRRYFYKGVVFTQNRPEAIRDSIYTAVRDHARLSSEVRTLRTELALEWSAKRKRLLTCLEGLASPL